MARLAKVVLLSAAIAAAAPAPAPAIPSDARITTAGLGPIRIGMTIREVERANHRQLANDDDARRDRCTMARLGRRVTGLFTGRRLARIYVRTRRYPTRSGVRVGDTERKVYDTYPGRIVTEPHKYTAGGRYLKYVDGNRKVVFETDGSRVVSVDTGRTPEIDYVEACS